MVVRRLHLRKTCPTNWPWAAVLIEAFQMELTRYRISKGQVYRTDLLSLPRVKKGVRLEGIFAPVRLQP
jgi:hypothetical protein